MTKRKPILCVDFDGVIRSIGDEGMPVDGAEEFLTEMRKHFDICVFGSKSRTPAGINTMKKYIEDNLRISWLTYPDHKPTAKVYIDDRAMLFDGTWPTAEELLAFRPYYEEG